MKEFAIAYTPRTANRLLALIVLIVLYSTGLELAASESGGESRLPTADDFQFIRELLQKAESGDSHAQKLLGDIYYEGKFPGVAVDQKAALKWFLLSAEQGNLDAIDMAVMCYDVGIGTEANKSEAFKWQLRAAELGSINSAHMVARVYRDKERAQSAGIAQDYSEALMWMTKAAMGGDDMAQKELGLLYEEGPRGLGTPKSDTKAYTWYAVAAAYGQYEADKKRDAVAEKMTSGQIAAAQAEADRLFEELRPAREKFEKDPYQ